MSRKFKVLLGGVRRIVLPLALVSGAIAAMLAAPVSAQIPVDGDLRREQGELFRQMFDQPDDLELMYRYALISVQLRDYEAAISTLERLLIFQPDSPTVEVELAAAYYRIGSYTIARYYFEEALADGRMSPEQIDRAEAFLDEIDDRTQTSQLAGSVSFNTIYTTNANNGPSSRLIDFAGLTVRLNGPDVTAQSDIGASLGFQATHIYDLGGTRDDSWRTNFASFSARYRETETGSTDVFVLRSGPRLAVNDDRYGPKARPYAEIDHVRSGDKGLYSTAGLGIEVTDTLDERRAIFGDLRVGFRDFHNNSAQELDGIQIRSLGGLNYFATDALLLRGLVLFEYDGAKSRSQRVAEIGAGLGATYRYDSGFDFAGRLWAISANATVLRREHFETDPVALVRRQDTDIRLSLGHTAHLKDNFALTFRADYFRRISNSRNFKLESFSINAGASYLF